MLKFFLVEYFKEIKGLLILLLDVGLLIGILVLAIESYTWMYRLLGTSVGYDAETPFQAGVFAIGVFGVGCYLLFSAVTAWDKAKRKYEEFRVK